jgi:hypothetical protein
LAYLLLSAGVAGRALMIRVILACSVERSVHAMISIIADSGLL